MHKGILITTDGKIEVRTFTDPLWKSIGATWGGYIEIVRPLQIIPGIVLVIDEEGALKPNKLNLLGSALYQNRIYGDAVIMKEGLVDGEPDLIELSDDDIKRLMAALGGK